MAETLAAFPDEDESRPRSRYPWDGKNGWLNGKVWKLVHGTPEQRKSGNADFDVAPKSFESAAKQAAKARPGQLRIAPQRDDKGQRTGFVIQFIPEQPVVSE